MKKQKTITRKISIGLSIGLIILVTAVAFAVQTRNDGTQPRLASEDSGVALETNKNLSKVILNVSNMSCSGCISSIKGSLEGIEGIQDILVDINNGKVEVYYDRKVLTEPSRIKKAITAGGYPAKVVKTINPEEIRKERDCAASKAQYYIASVSGYDISRTDFDVEMNVAKKRLQKSYGDEFTNPNAKSLDDRLKAQVASSLINEGVLRREIDRAGYKLDAKTNNSELEEYIRESGKTEKEFEKSILDAGYNYEYFKKKFETGLLINRYVDEKVLAETTDPNDRRRVFTSWFNNSRGLAEVVYYDKDVEKAIRNQSASSSCCAAK